MDDLDFEFHGFDELAGKMEAVARKVRGPVAKEMVRAGANVFKREMIDRAPVLDEKNSGSNSLEPGALKDDIRVRFPASEQLLDTTAAVGPGKKTAYVANFVEYGHRMVSGGQSKVGADGKVRGNGKVSDVDVPAYPFVRPAFEAGQGEAEHAMVEKFDSMNLETADGE